MPELHNKKITQICRWHPFESTSELEQTAVKEVLSAAQLAINDRGAFHIVLAGGTTPKKIYEALRDAKTTWSKWHIYYGDERYLPYEHADRNSHMADLAWLSHVAIPREHIHPIPAGPDVVSAAEKYARTVNKIKQFDLVLLGLGEDGHTASLFPEHDAGDTPDAPDTLIVMDAPKPPAQRISLSARRLSETRQLIYLVSGKNKSQAVKDWRTGSPIPAAKVTTENGVDIFIESTLLVDQ